MIKTYRRDEAGALHYLECWDHNSTFYVHKGKVGTKGQSLTRVLKGRNRPTSPTLQESVDSFRTEAAAKGYAELAGDDRGWLVLQVTLLSEDLSHEADLRVFDELPDAINDYVSWRGVGHYDGNDIGGGKINFFLPVADNEIAVKVVRRFLKEFGAPQPMLIATRAPVSSDPEADYTVAWAQRKGDRESFSLH